VCPVVLCSARHTPYAVVVLPFPSCATKLLMSVWRGFVTSACVCPLTRWEESWAPSNDAGRTSLP